MQRLFMVGLIVLGSAALVSNFALAGPKDEKAAPVSGSKKEDRKKKDEKKSKGTAMPALAYTMKDIDGKDQDLTQYAGKVVMMVNVASKCGFTPQYKGLQELYAKYKDKGFVILGFPANDFGHQEPGTEQEIKSFCTGTYNVTFPMFSKVHVKGPEICPLYKYLTSKNHGHKNGGDVGWNFTKFLINKKGEVVDRFDTRIKPNDEKVTQAIEKALDETVATKSEGTKAKTGN